MCLPFNIPFFFCLRRVDHQKEVPFFFNFSCEDIIILFCFFLISEVFFFHVYILCQPHIYIVGLCMYILKGLLYSLLLLSFDHLTFALVVTNKCIVFFYRIKNICVMLFYHYIPY